MTILFRVFGMKKYKKEELIRYLFNYCQDLLTDEEKLAYKNLSVLAKIENADSSGMKKMLRKRWYSSDKKVLDLLKDGDDEFFAKVEKRILENKPKKKFMNLCPKCSYLAITPMAKQCWKCYYSWHHESE